MDDQEFGDLIYQHWSRTTGSDDRYWMPVEYEDKSGRFNIYAVGQDETRKLVASGLSDKDSDFITAIHGCLPDLVRRLGSAIDEADRLDVEKDEAICRVAQLELEADEFESIIGDLTEKLADMESGRV
jgi:hypothetical protein